MAPASGKEKENPSSPEGNAKRTETVSKPEESLAEEERTAANVARTIRRNQSRWETADTSDRATVGESSREKGEKGSRDGKRVREKRQHLTNNADAYFDDPVEGPNDAFSPPSWFFEEVTRIATSVPHVPTKPPIVFENHDEAARQTEQYLQRAASTSKNWYTKTATRHLGTGRSLDQ